MHSRFIPEVVFHFRYFQPEMNNFKLRKGPISKLEPSEFQIGDDDETYMIGAEVGYVMGLEKVSD